MDKNIHNLIMSDYDKKRKTVSDNLMVKKNEVYLNIPEIQKIDNAIHMSGIKLNKMVLAGKSSSDKAIEEMYTKIESLKKQKSNLLSHNGYSSNYLESTYHCSTCNDTGFINDDNSIPKKCSCYKQQMIDLLYSHSNLNVTATENFDSFDEKLYPESPNKNLYGLKISPRENILNIKKRCIKFIENFSSPQEKNLFFSGATGVGKTFMSNCIARELISRGRVVLYQTAPTLFNIINKQKMNNFNKPENEDTSYKNILEVELLIIDDLGTEPPSAARYAELLTILNTRHLNNMVKPCKTIISTNLGPKELNEYYTERVSSRIIGNFERLMFIGEDIRCIVNN